MKKFLKFSLLTFSLIILYSAWGVLFFHQNQAENFVKNSLNLNKPCSKPLTFSIGQIDARFPIKTEELKILSQEAIAVWNTATGQELLKYDPTASFKINLVFDERQLSFMESEKMEENLKNLENSHSLVKNEYAALISVYEKKKKIYEKAVSEYKERTEEYNEEVEKWNKKGGAPEDVYEDLEKEKEELEKDFEKLEKQRKELNALVKKSQALVSQESKIVENYNQNVNTYKMKFGESREFEKGLFSGTEINIYQFQEKSDLKLTLIHELGHYVGLSHVENPKSIMYYLIGEQDLDNPVLTAEDRNELKKVCEL